MSGGIESIFNPSAIAVVGATNRHGSVCLAVFSNLIHGGYQGIIYPVNPKARSVQGVRAYPTVADVPDEIDLAVIVVPAEHVAAIIEEKLAGKDRRYLGEKEANEVSHCYGLPPSRAVS